MSLQTIKDLALLLLYPLALVGALYAYCLWRLVLGLKKRLDELYVNCRQVHQHLDGQYLSAHRVEHQSLWEALHHHEHGPKKQAGRVIKIIGRS
jgi:hypothetical protein